MNKGVFVKFKVNSDTSYRSQWPNIWYCTYPCITYTCTDGILPSSFFTRNLWRFKWHCLQLPNINTLKLRQNGRHFPDIFQCIFLNENVWIAMKISLMFVPKDTINNIPELVQIMTWPRPGNKPLSEPTMVSLLTHICITRPQWVNGFIPSVRKNSVRLRFRQYKFQPWS